MSKGSTLTLLCGLMLSTSVIADNSFIRLDRAQAKALTTSTAHTTPTIVALWSSECIHCKANLKLIAAMTKADPRIRVITVATETVSADLAEPLDRLTMPGQRYAYGNDSPESIAFALDPQWSGELPRTMFFDGRGGKRAHSGLIDEAGIRKALRHEIKPAR